MSELPKAFAGQAWQVWDQNTIVTAQGAPTAISATAPTGMIRTVGARSLRIRVIGDTDGDNAELMLYHVDLIGAGTEVLYITKLFLDANTWTIGDGTTKGVADGAIIATEFFADTVDAPTVNAYGTHLLQMVNGVANEYSPADNTIAELFISDLANAYGIVPRFDTLTTGNYFGLLYKLDR